MVQKIKDGLRSMQGVPFRLGDKELAWCCFGGAAMCLLSLAVMAM